MSSNNISYGSAHSLRTTAIAGLTAIVLAASASISRSEDNIIAEPTDMVAVEINGQIVPSEVEIHRKLINEALQVLIPRESLPEYVRFEGNRAVVVTNADDPKAISMRVYSKDGHEYNVLETVALWVPGCADGNVKLYAFRKELFNGGSYNLSRLRAYAISHGGFEKDIVGPNGIPYKCIVVGDEEFVRHEFGTIDEQFAAEVRHRIKSNLRLEDMNNDIANRYAIFNTEKPVDISSILTPLEVAEGHEGKPIHLEFVAPRQDGNDMPNYITQILRHHSDDVYRQAIKRIPVLGRLGIDPLNVRVTIPLCDANKTSVRIKELIGNYRKFDLSSRDQCYKPST